jgi:hypothetical protein
MMNGIQKAAAGALLVLTGAACSTTSTQARQEPLPPVAGAPEPGTTNPSAKETKAADSATALTELKTPQKDKLQDSAALTPEMAKNLLERFSGYSKTELAKLSAAERTELTGAVYGYIVAVGKVAEAKGENSELKNAAEAAQQRLSNSHAAISRAHPDFLPVGVSAKVESGATPEVKPQYNSAEAEKRAVARNLLRPSGSAARTPVEIPSASAPQDEYSAEGHAQQMARGGRIIDRRTQEASDAELRARISGFEAASKHSEIGVERDVVALAKEKMTILAELRNHDAQLFQQGLDNLTMMREQSRQASWDSVNQRWALANMDRDRAFLGEDLKDRELDRWRRGAGESLGTLLYAIVDPDEGTIDRNNAQHAQLRNGAIAQIESNEARADKYMDQAAVALERMREDLLVRMMALREIEYTQARSVMNVGADRYPTR